MLGFLVVYFASHLILWLLETLIGLQNFLDNGLIMLKQRWKSRKKNHT